MAFEGLFIFAIVPHRLRRMRPHILIAAVTILSTLGCSKDEAAADAAAAPSASAPAPSTVASVAPTPSASASAAPEAQHDCPTGSTGPGTFTKPCEAKGGVADGGDQVERQDRRQRSPSFAVTSKSTRSSSSTAKIAVYFYDKAGKQLDVKDEAGRQGAPVPHVLGQLLRRRDEAGGEGGPHVLVRAEEGRPRRHRDHRGGDADGRLRGRDAGRRSTSTGGTPT